MMTYMLVFSNPVAGREDEYNEWYDNVHLREVVDIDGIQAARRYRLADSQVQPEQAHRYLAIYEVDSGNVEAAIRNLLGGRGMQMSDALDLTTAKVAVYRSIGPEVR